MYFLATPHRGSDLARTLSNILRVVYRQKAYVNELEPNSALLSSMNDSFRHYAQDLQLWSFYETVQSSLPGSKAIIVDKVSATLGYPHERIALLNADHRGVCKFDQPTDPNYKSLRNAFSSTIDTITNEGMICWFHVENSHSQTIVLRLRQEASRIDLRNLAVLLGNLELPTDDLLDLEDTRVPGSCEWFTNKEEFTKWRLSLPGTPSLLWLSGNPGSGKSVLASHVVRCLEGYNLDCSHFFFKRGAEGKSFLSDCLRSLAYQMALANPQIKEVLLKIQASGIALEKYDERTTWRKLFMDGVFRAELRRPHYWVIDALDECNKVHSFFSIMSNIDGDFPLRILITSRKGQEIEQGFSQLRQKTTQLDMLLSDTIDDIKSFISAKIGRLPVKGGKSLASLSNRILAKSGGSFLWVRLVIHELENTWAEEVIEEVLNEIPDDMNLLYKRILDDMSKMSRAAKLAKAILTWTVCALRPLTLREMQCALKIDLNETIHNLDRSISSLCGQLVFVDQRSRIQIIHQTAAQFLLDEDLDSEFAVSKIDGHAQLATKCLEFLSGNQFKPPRGRRQKLAVKPRLSEDSLLADYACTFFSDHLFRTSSSYSEPWEALNHFLGSSVLSWIEYLAKTGDLYYITRTAINIKAYLGRRAEHFPPICHQSRSVDAWTVDLIRLSAKFRTNLIAMPSSIYWLIPPLCPSESIIAQKFASPHRGLIVKGLLSKTWDDCLTRFSYRDCLATAISYGDCSFAVGLSSGKVFVYQSVSGQINWTLEHLERVKILAFSSQDQVLASSSLQKIQIWDLSNGQSLWAFKTLHQVLALAFTHESKSLMAATQGSYVISWYLSDGTEKVQIPWQDNCDENSSKRRQSPLPTHALFSPDQSLLAVSYRGRPILLYDLESEIFFGNCVRERGLNRCDPENHYPIVAMAFNPNPEGYLLVVSYGDGELTIYDPWTLEVRHRSLHMNAHTLACSPDGRTLVTGSSSGTIQVFDFDGVAGETLTLIYRINAYEEGIKSLTFSNDSLRFIDIRGSQCRVWEPLVLVRKDIGDCDESDISDPNTMMVKSITLVEEEMRAEITAMVCHPDGEVVFCGREDGSVSVVLTEDAQDCGVLYSHCANVTVTSVAWGQRNSILASVDESSRIIIRRILKNQSGWSGTEILADKRCTGSIVGLLFNPSSDRLLVSGTVSDELWTINGQKIGSRTYEHQNHRRAVSHPSHSDNFVLLGPDVAHIFNWEDFTDVTGPDGTRLDRISEPIVMNSVTSTSYAGERILTELFKIHGDHSLTHIDCWEISGIHKDAKFITPLPGFERLGPIIEHIIAVDGNSLYFLDIDLWVCSLNLTTFAMIPEMKRHFFIPSDWNRTSREMLFQFTSVKEFVIAKRQELLIIKGAAQYFEITSLTGD